jgi:hypothetical protein
MEHKHPHKKQQVFDEKQYLDGQIGPEVRGRRPIIGTSDISIELADYLAFLFSM